MSFSVALVKYRGGDAVEFPTEPLVRVLGEHGIDHLGSEYVSLSDGLNVDLDTGALAQATVRDLSISFRHISPALFRLLYDLAKTEALTIVVFGAQTIALSMDDASAKELPEGFAGAPVICQSSDDVARAITEPFNAWRSWVDG
jgi:hypothetical protein